MTEEEARVRVAEGVSRETLDGLDRLVALVSEENARQNLVSPSTLSIMWSRHILDSAQLFWLAEGASGSWLDIGSGGGFPGLVIALMRSDLTILAEPRSKRATFLRETADALGIVDRVRVAASRVETAPIDTPVSIVSARAVAALPALFAMAARHTTKNTLWLLPKGRSAADEVAEAAREWQGDLRLVPSLSDPDSAIVVARAMRRISG
ncbi:16S rRNA (guanine(527)-N(7))-methyltransferase RsmG [Sphingomonas sp. AP4-R1]|uniref:16S rRNA (guanine(527)-N(7))-methyltransferase RsmG n=1 Tax=Sphingomonas sp. AP4-R1 TaxID=2735134 RepID=UPI001493AE5B|nr:16S rRNA (guanine(527)-N(7))-methyltransferase RsmG [Sphingomonas sp. AP4-R1]QJU57235.1 16S rRNA (guanine(527)-N(7))-methyltransferase RsmG [Sphingomonas sp. AP4-R1]